jgi:putative SOS response-associated peptidase YedK
MCGRYTLTTPGEQLRDVFGLEENLELAPRFNIAPTQMAPVVRAGQRGSTEMALLRWGLVPYWAEETSIGNRLINARAETVDRKPAYRDSFAGRRCLVVADGFYEWQPIGRHKQPYFFSRADGEPFAIAGIWSRWTRGSEPVESFALITTEANDVVRPVHSRMPAILEPEVWESWLYGGAERLSSRLDALRPARNELLRGHAVSTYVNSPANDTSRCLEAIEPSEIPAGAEALEESPPQGRLF